MKVAIISDVHANPQALERVLDDAARCGVEQVVCAGDVVGYGPDPAGTIRILRERNIPTVMGNHDVAVANYFGTGSMCGSAQAGVARHRAELEEDDVAWLRSLPYVYLDPDNGFEVAHANCCEPMNMGYVHNRSDARDSILNGRERRQFIGHTHLEALYRVKMDGYPDCERLEPNDFKMEEGWAYLVNVGSVGYPRVRGYSAYAILDSATRGVQFRRVEFDFAAYKAALQAKSIPIPSFVEESEKNHGES